MKKAKVKILRNNERQVERDLVLKERKIYTKEWEVKSRNNLITP